MDQNAEMVRFLGCLRTRYPSVVLHVVEKSLAIKATNVKGKGHAGDRLNFKRPGCSPVGGGKS